MNTRIYTVYNDNERYLVRATTRNQAIAYVARQMYACRIATQDDLIEITKEGGTVLDNTDGGAGDAED